MQFSESKKFISMLQLNREFIENSLEIDPNPPADVTKLLKMFNEVISAAERARNENHWDKLFSEYSDEIQTILDFVQMLANATSPNKGKKINRMKKTLNKKSIAIDKNGVDESDNPL